MPDNSFTNQDDEIAAAVAARQVDLEAYRQRLISADPDPTNYSPDYTDRDGEDLDGDGLVWSTSKRQYTGGSGAYPKLIIGARWDNYDQTCGWLKVGLNRQYLNLNDSAFNDPSKPWARRYVDPDTQIFYAGDEMADAGPVEGSVRFSAVPGHGYSVAMFFDTVVSVDPAHASTDYGGGYLASYGIVGLEPNYDQWDYEQGSYVGFMVQGESTGSIGSALVANYNSANFVEMNSMPWMTHSLIVPPDIENDPFVYVSAMFQSPPDDFIIESRVINLTVMDLGPLWS